MAYNTKSIIKDVNGKPVPQYFNKETDKYEVIESADGFLKVNMIDKEGQEIQSQELVDQINSKVGELTDSLNSLDYVKDLAGEGRTTETVKKNADNIIELEQDLIQYKEEITIKRQQDQLKVATVEKGLNDYKATMANVNVNQEAKQKVTGYGTISLPKNTANGQVSVSVKGETHTNIGGNSGDCEDISNFGIVGSLLSLDGTSKVVGNNSIIVTSVVSSGGFGMLGKIVDWKIDPTKYYLVSAYVKNINSLGVALRVFKGSANSYLGSVTTETTVANFIRQGVILQPSDLIGETAIRPYIRAICDAIGQKISVDGIMLNEITSTEYSLGIATLLAKYPYVNGTNSTISTSRLKSVEVNIYNGKVKNEFVSGTQGQTGGSSDFIPVKKGEVYKGLFTGISSQTRAYYYDIDKKEVKYHNIAPTIRITPEQNGYVKLQAYNANGISTNDRFLFGKYDLLTIDTPYKESTSYLPNVGELRSLPNGTYDEIKVSEGKLIKRVSEQILQPTHILSMYTSHENLDWARIDKPLDSLGYSNSLSEWLSFPNYTESKGTLSNNDLISNIGKFITSGNITQIFVGVPKGTTLEQARQQLAGLTLIYQLAQEIVTPIQTSGNLISYPSGTVYVENVVADAGNYTTKFDIKELQLPIKSIDKLIKYNFTTGVQTVLDATLAVINADKKSFTHPNLAKDDMVFVDYFYDVESTLGETTIEYLDSRHTIKDTTNSKFYSWDIKSTNGVPTVALTEVL